MPEDPKGATPLPRGAFPLTREAVGFIPTIRRQFLAGLNDVTAFLAKPLEAATGTVVIRRGRLEFIGPNETARRRRAGDIGILGMATSKPRDVIGHGARVSGQTVAIAPVLGRVLAMVNRARGVSGAGTAFARAPVRTTAVEGALGFTAGAAGGIARESGASGESVLVAEIAGGTAPRFTPTMLAIRGALAVVNRARAARRINAFVAPVLLEHGGAFRDNNAVPRAPF